MANLFAAILVMITLLFLTFLFFHLPQSTLAAVIIGSLVSLFDYHEMIFLYKTKKPDLLVLATTFIGVLFLGIEVRNCLLVTITFVRLVLLVEF
jgi:SulP family sulfate permease